MKRRFLGTVSVGTLSILLAGGLVSVPAIAAEKGDPEYQAAMDSLKQDIAKLREENAALRERQRLSNENTALKDNLTAQGNTPGQGKAQTAATAQKPGHVARPQAYPVPAILQSAPRSALDAYAADMPIKAPAPVDRGETRLWIDGGAIWTRGDPVNVFFPGSGGYFGFGFGGGGPADFFGMVPNVGFEAAGGFDHRLAGTPWHVSGEVRYGQGKGSDSTSSAFSLSVASASLAESSLTTGTDKESHAIADFAVGRDLGVGKDAVQFKVGIRLAEIKADLVANQNDTATVSGIATPIPTIGGGTTSSFTFSSLYTNTTTSVFRGAGPRIGLEGTVPFGNGWAFDYLADAAALFGTQKSTTSTITTLTVSPIVLVPIGVLSNSTGPITDSRPTTVFNADLQAGIGYWFTPNLKLTASYRVDAFYSALLTFDAAGNSVKADRIYHGPHLTLTGDF